MVKWLIFVEDNVSDLLIFSKALGIGFEPQRDNQSLCILTFTTLKKNPSV